MQNAFAFVYFMFVFVIPKTVPLGLSCVRTGRVLVKVRSLFYLQCNLGIFTKKETGDLLELTILPKGYCARNKKMI